MFDVSFKLGQRVFSHESPARERTSIGTYFLVRARTSSFAVVASNFIYVARMFALAANSHVLPLNLLHIPRRLFLYSKCALARPIDPKSWLFLRC